jgi:hypothetical protein
MEMNKADKAKITNLLDIVKKSDALSEISGVREWIENSSSLEIAAALLIFTGRFMASNNIENYRNNESVISIGYALQNKLDQTRNMH